MLKEKITASLEKEFSQYGFAEPSVAQLKTTCNVSLRTLYKYYPSKEMMIVAALNYRHQRYITFLQDDSTSDGVESILNIFNKLEQWMEEFAPHGCLSINAIAAFPDNADIASAVKSHKQAVRIFIAQKSQREDLATALFLLHEGVSNTWPVFGAEAITSAKQTISQLMETNK